MIEKLRWGILGTGSIAGKFARGVTHSRTGTLYAVGSRTQEAAERFGEQWSISHRYGSYEALLQDKDVQAIYIATPHPFHARWAIQAAEAGKHVLCEKPLALNHAEAMAIVEAAQRNNVFLMEAYMYRCHPQIDTLLSLIRDGAIGEVKLIQASFSFQTSPNPESRLMNNALGGGGILDVGGYPVSMARLIAGVANGKPFEDPLSVVATGVVGKTGIDEYTTASLAFPGGILAQLTTGVRLRTENVVRVMGSKGSLLLPDPWTPPDAQNTKIILYQYGKEQPEEIEVECTEYLYGLEADTVANSLEQREAAAMSWRDSLGNMRTLDLWRQAIGVVYEAEKPEGKTLTVSGRPLAVRPGSKMKYGTLPGVEKQVARLVMGVDNQTEWPHASVMFDDYFERGGNCFDTAFIYGGGRCETVLGQWIKNRGVREQVVILGKGAHTPFCTPEWLTKQLLISLERLQTDYLDIYMLHRDNPEIPVSEFITVLNEHKQAGRIRAFGASNWSLARVEEANRWAAEHGLSGFVAVSNNFSLARMVEPVWAGCIAASDSQSRAWLEERQMALMPWSSQARGFFTGRARPDDHSDPELVRCWYSEDNFQRLERVNQMAREKQVLPISIALAYVLSQPFPTFPLIGPRALEETRTSFEALEIELTPDEVRWLNLERDHL